MQVRFVYRLVLIAVSSAAFFSVSDAIAQESSGHSAYRDRQAEIVRDLWQLNEPLVTADDKTAFVKIERDFRSVLNSGPLNTTNRELLDKGLKYTIHALSNGDKTPAEIAIDFQALTGRMGRAGNAILNANNKKKFRDEVFGLAAKHTQDLLSNNLLSRSLGLELLLEFEVVQPRAGQRIQMHDAIHETYLSVLGDPEQPDAVKARAANCAKKYLEKANATPLLEVKFAEALAAELKRPETEAGYQDTLIAALERIRAPRQLVGTRQPVHFRIAAEVLQDNTRDILVRCRAARVFGRGAYDSQIYFEPLAWAVAQLTLETGFRYRNAKDRANPTWKRCGWYLYTAFHHENRRESDRGFLNRDKRSMIVSTAYKACVPVMAHLMFDTSPTPVNLLTAVDKWAKSNVPAKMAFDSTCPPIKTGQGQ